MNNNNNHENRNSNIKWNILKMQYPKAGARAALDPEVEIGLSDPYLLAISILGFGVVALLVYFIIFRAFSKGSILHGKANSAAAAGGTDVSTLNRAQRRARAKSVAASAVRDEQQQQQQQQQQQHQQQQQSTTTRQRRVVKAMEREELLHLQEQRRLEVEAMGGKSVLEEANKEERKQRQLAEEARRREQSEIVEKAKKLQEYREYHKWKYLICDESSLLSLSLEELEADHDETYMTVLQFIQLCEKRRLVEINDELCQTVSCCNDENEKNEKDVCTPEELLQRIRQLVRQGRLSGVLSFPKTKNEHQKKEESPYFIYVSKKEMKQLASTIVSRQEEDNDDCLSDIRTILFETLLEN